MYCQKCGTQLPDDANFCLKCGAAQRTQAKSPLGSKSYEVCYLKIKSGLLNSKWEAWVGKNKIAESSLWSQILALENQHLVIEKNSELVAQLMSDGWVTQTTNDSGWVITMNRKN